MVPETKYAKSGNLHIAYQVVGDGPLDLVFVHGWISHIEHAVRLGDRRWHDLLDAYYRVVRQELAQFRGREIDSAGDGVFASFDGPARAIRCACALRTAVHGLGLAVRVGVHTGECEVIGPKIGGLAVHIGARVSDAAEVNDVLVSSTVKDLVAGSGIHFEDRGTHALKGVPGEWRLFAVAAVPAAV